MVHVGEPLDVVKVSREAPVLIFLGQCSHKCRLSRGVVCAAGDDSQPLLGGADHPIVAHIRAVCEVEPFGPGRVDAEAVLGHSPGSVAG
jgi:hypothetical protein